MPDIGWLNQLINWLAQEWIAIIALIIALLSFYFGSLKGPDIDWLKSESSRLNMKEIHRKDQKYIPNRIEFDPAKFIFTNNGTRSGVIKLETIFEPSDELRPFFKGVDYIFRTDKTGSTSEMPYISISERESCIVDVGITVELHIWKGYFRHGPVSKEQISGILSQADRQNYERLSRFCSALRPGMPIGRISIDSIQTVRKRFFWTEVNKRNLVRNQLVGTIDREFIDGFKYWLEKWDDVEPNCILNRVDVIRNGLSSDILNPIEGTLRKFEKTPLVEFPTGFWNDWRKKWEGYNDWKPIVNFIFHSSQLESRVTTFCSNADRFNRDLQNYRGIRDEDKQEKDKKKLDLLDRAKKMTEEAKSIIDEINSVQDILYKCVHSGR